MKDIFSFTKQGLQQQMVLLGEKPFRATQIFEWVYKKQVFDFSLMLNISKSSQTLLQQHFYFGEMITEKVQTASDGTEKYLFRLADGERIETVLMRYSYGNSVCVSTQVGCNMGCGFCASGFTKRKRHLDVSEMVLQVMMIQQRMLASNERISHIVVMGMGEPFDNYDNVIDFLYIMNDHKGLDIGARHMTVSTCGIVPKIIAFSQLPLQINLAISLHFPNDDLRNQHMPINKAYPLDDLFAALQTYYQRTKRRITFEYILIDGINDSIHHAQALVERLKGLNCYVNLIPLNETKVKFRRSKQQTMNKFYQILAKNNIQVTLRRELGHEIEAACGQLRLKSEE